MKKIIKALLITSIFVLAIFVFAKKSLGVYVCQYTYDKTNCSVEKTDKWVSDTEETKPCVANTDNGSVCYSATETSYTACDQMGCVGKRAVTYTAVGVAISSYRCETRDCGTGGGPTSTPTPGGGGNYCTRSGSNIQCNNNVTNCQERTHSWTSYTCPNCQVDSGCVEAGVENSDWRSSTCCSQPTATPTPASCSKPGKPTLQSPNNNTNNIDRTPTFNWSDVNKPANCNSVKYDIQVKEGSATGTNIINKSDLANSTCTAGSAPCQFVSGKNIVAGKSYFWHVRASTSKGNSGWTGFWKYTVTSTGPTNTPAPSATVSPTPPGPTPTVNPNCVCASNVCSASCIFNKFPNPITYTSPIKCNLALALFPTAPTGANKTDWCRRNLKTKGDTDGSSVINNTDYFYYVAAVNGGKIPVIANPDFNGDGEVGLSDRVIIIKSLNP